MIAVLIDSIVKRQKFFRTVSLLPTLLPPVTVALVWQIMLANNDGLFNSILNILGFAGYNFLGEIDTAFWCILLIDIWQYSPFAFLFSFEFICETFYCLDSSPLDIYLLDSLEVQDLSYQNCQLCNFRVRNDQQSSRVRVLCTIEG